MSPARQRFPAPVREGMRVTGAAATCVPVRTEARSVPPSAAGSQQNESERDGWEAALFVQLAGPECKADRQA
ncbi:MAG: hypothetical protein ACR2RL_21090, partial [Gammaproteobacteria bacterium]